jgi:hypothetical protein
MIELTQHKTNEVNEKLKIEALGVPKGGGAYCYYRISGYNVDFNDAMIGGDFKSTYLLFQNGPVAEVGVNGITHEALLAVLIDRLRCFQNGPYANKHDAAALQHLEDALMHLQARTLERQARGVEGTHGL